MSEALHTPTQNVHIAGLKPLVSPAELTRRFPASIEQERSVLAGRQTIRDILAGTDRRLLVVIGPCSIHDPEAALDYAQRLAALRDQVQEHLFIVMRVYFEKPRTTVGWKGLINDPHLDGSFDLEKGLELARTLLLQITALGLPTGTEFLDPFTPQYIDDLVAWAAIGARTTESQTHRQMASGLSMPVGYKNGTDGSLEVALNAMTSAQAPHHFLGIDEDGRVSTVATRGNPDGHLILRGGAARTNYHPEDVQAAAAQLKAAGLPQALMVDCSHANSGKKHENQEGVWDSLVAQRVADPASPLVAAMVESNLEAGSQSLGADRSQLRRGVSITDACIGWAKTEELLLRACEALG